MWSLVGLVFFVFTISQALSDTPACGTFLDEYGATFDFTPLSIPFPQSYIVKDIYAASALHNYTYFFNLCNLVPPPVPECGNVNTPAFQVYTGGDQSCFTLGRTTNATDMTFRPIDWNDATVGILMSYHNGQPCAPDPRRPTQQISRELHIQIICDDSFSDLPDLFVAEDSPCHYKVDFRTIWGCPRECRVGPNLKLCSGNGFCGQDWITKTPKCFCNQAHFGDDCSLTSNPAMGDTACKGLCVGLALVVVILAMLAVGAVVMLWKVRKLALKKLKFAATNSEMHVVAPTGDV